MTEPFEDLLVRLAEEGDPSVIERLPRYLSGHLAQFSDHRYGFGSAAAERERLAVAFRNKAPQTELSGRMLDSILELTN